MIWVLGPLGFVNKSVVTGKISNGFHAVLKLKYAIYLRRAFAIMLVRRNNVFGVKQKKKCVGTHRCCHF